MRLITLLLALHLLSTVPAAAQDGTATPPALASKDPNEIVAALEEAEAPDTLPGNTDPEVLLMTWEEHYGEELDGTLGAWVMTGSAVFPMASVLVFPTSEDAANGLGEYRRESAATTAGPLDAWLIADRGKWVCVAVDGPVLFIGQGEPVDTDEPEATVQERACDVVATTHAWLRGVVGIVPGTPTASPPA